MNAHTLYTLHTLFQNFLLCTHLGFNERFPHSHQHSKHSKSHSQSHSMWLEDGIGCASEERSEYAAVGRQLRIRMPQKLAASRPSLLPATKLPQQRLACCQLWQQQHRYQRSSNEGAELLPSFRLPIHRWVAFVASNLLRRLFLSVSPIQLGGAESVCRQLDYAQRQPLKTRV